MELPEHSLTFETEVGVIRAHISKERVKVKMPDPSDLKLAYPLELSHRSFSISSINTGVPHVVVMVEQIDNIDVVALGKEIRFHPAFAPAGTMQILYIAANPMRSLCELTKEESKTKRWPAEREPLPVPLYRPTSWI